MADIDADQAANEDIASVHTIADVDLVSTSPLSYNVTAR